MSNYAGRMKWRTISNFSTLVSISSAYLYREITAKLTKVFRINKLWNSFGARLILKVRWASPPPPVPAAPSNNQST